MDATTAAHIQRLVEAGRLLGAEVVVCGIGPAIAGVMVDMGSRRAPRP
jgi:anti-anti-sigma regulatory factor